MGFSRQENWNGLPFSTPGYLPDPGIKPTSPLSPALAGGFFTDVPPGKPKTWHNQINTFLKKKGHFPLEAMCGDPTKCQILFWMSYLYHVLNFNIFSIYFYLCVYLFD